jgi:hypothetical protein
MEAISGGTITEAKPPTTASPYSAGTRVADGRQGGANLDAGLTVTGKQVDDNSATVRTAAPTADPPRTDATAESKGVPTGRLSAEVAWWACMCRSGLRRSLDLSDW